MTLEGGVVWEGERKPAGVVWTAYIALARLKHILIEDTFLMREHLWADLPILVLVWTRKDGVQERGMETIGVGQKGERCSRIDAPEGSVGKKWKTKRHEDKSRVTGERQKKSPLLQRGIPQKDRGDGSGDRGRGDPQGRGEKGNLPVLLQA